MSLSFRAFKAGSKSDFSKLAFPAILGIKMHMNILIFPFSSKKEIAKKY